MRSFFYTAILALTINSALAQSPTGFSRGDLEGIQNYTGLPDSVISQRFGSPDEVGFDEGKQAVVWTYITEVSGETAGSNPIAGYHQFAFWNGKVAGYRTRRFTDEQQANAMYDSTLSYMSEHTVGRAGNADSTFFTENLRIARRGDNIWYIDMLRDNLNSHATLIVGDAGYKGCDLVVKSESRRIEKKFGIKVTDEGGIQSQ